MIKNKDYMFSVSFFILPLSKSKNAPEHERFYGIRVAGETCRERNVSPEKRVAREACRERNVS